jgi:hypothetical protein
MIDWQSTPDLADVPDGEAQMLYIRCCKSDAVNQVL